MNAEMKPQATIESMLGNNKLLNDPATVKGLESLLERVAPLLQAERFHNVVDVLSALSDVVNMADNDMVEKLAHSYENLASAAFRFNGAMRHATTRAAREESPPSLWQTLRRLNKDEDARRGLSMLATLLATLGRDVRFERNLMQESE